MPPAELVFSLWEPKHPTMAEGDLPRQLLPKTLARFILSLDLLLCAVLCPRLGLTQAQLSDAKEIVQRSAEVNQRDWKQLSSYDYFVRRHEDGTTKTYRSQMLLGSPYNRLVAINERPLSPAEAAAESDRFNKELAKRQKESPDERRQRIAKYQKEVDRNNFFMNQLATAFDFTLSGTDTIAGHEVYVLAARPRPGYHPPNMEAKALTGMQGTLWVDRANFHWVRVRAEVVQPVYIEGFLAKVERGTRFELDQEPVADGVWLPSRFMMQAHAKVMFLFSHHEQQNEDYFDYRKSDQSPSENRP